jgi:type IV pilus assembly protein PilE
MKFQIHLKSTGSNMMKHSHGFSIIELLIVVALITIIGAISMGFFGDSVIRAKRTEARSTLTEVAGSLEKCRSLYGAYNAANCNVAFPVASDANLYSITGVVAASTFTLTATPVAGLSQANDADCTSLTLTNTGVKAATGADTSDCW